MEGKKGNEGNMFSLVKLKSPIQIYPNELNDINKGTIYDIVFNKLKKRIEGSVLGLQKYHVILMINIDVDNFITDSTEGDTDGIINSSGNGGDGIMLRPFENGKIGNACGEISYNIDYNAVVFKPIIGENVDVIVDFINNRGIWGKMTLLPTANINCICLKEKIVNYAYINGVWVGKEDNIEVGSIFTMKIIHFQIDSDVININGAA